MDQPEKHQVDGREAAIMQAAFQAFAAYGFRRTTMEDIAAAAGLSRTALYLHFRNKDDLFRRMALLYLDESERGMAAALAQDGTAPHAALQAAFVARDGHFMEIVMGTPHGRELLEAGISVAGEAAVAAEARQEVLLRDWFAGFDLAEGLGDPARMARTLLAALKGLKHASATVAAYRDGQARLARLFALGLLRRKPAGGTCGEIVETP